MNCSTGNRPDEFALVKCPDTFVFVFLNLYSAAHSSGKSVAPPTRTPRKQIKVLRMERNAGIDPGRMAKPREEGRDSTGRDRVIFRGVGRVPPTLLYC